MKQRFSALDGLRGFAALSVVLSHINLNLSIFSSFPIISVIYKSLSDGPNSVQIFFVLSGFLMGYFYFNVSNALRFIQKRYTRIFPLLFVLITYIWIISIAHISQWYFQLFTLLSIAIFVNFIWKFIKKINGLGKIIFFLFLVLQVITIIISVFIIPHHSQLINSNFLQTIMNLTLTTPFFPLDIKMRSVLWSLAPEILFYILFPFIAIPLMRLGEKYGIVISIIIAISMIKILFDLDSEFAAIAKLQSMNIARSSGFVIGILVAEIYRSQGKIWKKFESIIKNPFIDITILFLLLAFQFGDLPVRGDRGVLFNNFYFLISSIAIGFAIIAALNPKTILSRIFSHKILVFLGTISYSIYLIHTDVINWVIALTNPLKGYIHSYDLYMTIILFVELFATILVSLFLYKTVEFMYFVSKDKIALDKKTKKTINTKPILSKTFIASVTTVTIIVLFAIYSSRFTGSFILERQAINKDKPNTEISLLNKTVDIPFYSRHNGLSIVSVDIRYFKSAVWAQENIKTPAQIIFKLYDSNKNLLFQSQSTAYLVEGGPHFQFGFPPIPDSNQKNYIIELSLNNGSKNDLVFLENSPSGMIEMYSLSRKDLKNIFSLIINRIIFITTIPEIIFAFGFFILAAILQNKQFLKKLF